MTRRVFIIAVENSGDQLGAGLIENLRAQDPDIHIDGIGGSAMATQGVSSDIDISPLAILGFVEALRVYPIVLDRVRQTVNAVIDSGAEAVILIDSWGFMIRVAKALKKRRFKGAIIKYVAPQVWAMREGRSKILAASVDHLLTIHSFDAPYFERHDLPVHYVGNPVFDIDYSVGNAKALREAYSIPDTAPIVGVFFGSRLSEIQTLAKPFADAVEQIKSAQPDAVLFSPVSETIATDVAAAAGADPRLQDIVLLPEARKFDVFASVDVALACSGTVTTQLACVGVPTVVAYRLNALTFAVARHLYKPDYISIVNIAAGEPLLPEHVQKDCTGDALADDILAFINDATKRKEASEALLSQTAQMRGEGGQADARAAQAVLKILKASER